MDHYNGAFVGIDTSKLRNAIAVAEEGRGGDERSPDVAAALNANRHALEQLLIRARPPATWVKAIHRE